MEVEANRGEKREAAPLPDAGGKSSKISAVTVEGEELYVLDEHLDLDFPVDEEMNSYFEDDDVEDYGESWHGRGEKEGPPSLSEEELEKVDEASQAHEVKRLVEMGVLEQVEALPPGAELLKTKHVIDWRFREGQWQRRARLVCKQLKIWDPNRSDVYAPSTSPSSSKLLPALMVSRSSWKLQSFDVKDAFLTVKQGDELYVLLDGVPFRVLRCLPGQQSASAWWSEQATEDLKEAGLVPDAACPSAFGTKGLGVMMHVDDGLNAGEDWILEKVKVLLMQKYKLEVSDVAFDVGESVKFLKKEFVITDLGVEVRVSGRYLEKIFGILDIKRPRECDGEMAAKYRGAIGGFLYLSPDRPDCQWAIAHLARAMSRPTVKMFKHAIHLAEYMMSTKDACQVFRWTYPGRSCLDDRVLSRSEARVLQEQHKGDADLVESVSDSDWAGHFDRAIYIKHIVQTLSSAPSRLLCRLDSSSARSLLQKKGVSRVRHLDTKLLWLQRMANNKEAEFAAISTHVNTSDIGTKVLSAERYHFLMCRLGYKGFVSSLRDHKKYDQIHSKVLRLLMVMDSMRVAAGSSVTVEENEFRGLHIESVLSIHLPAWGVVAVIVIVILAFVSVIAMFGGWCSRKEDHEHQQGSGEHQDEDEGEEHNDDGDDGGENNHSNSRNSSNMDHLRWKGRLRSFIVVSLTWMVIHIMLYMSNMFAIQFGMIGGRIFLICVIVRGMGKCIMFLSADA
ncbi:GIP [Symbiodinium sp. CCMP2592]|nr:GIP [Symbiodinium sp. CCMP2592]